MDEILATIYKNGYDPNKDHKILKRFFDHEKLVRDYFVKHKVEKVNIGDNITITLTRNSFKAVEFDFD